MNIQKSSITLLVKDQPAQAYLAAPEGGGPGVLVLHAWWGLKPFIKEFCDRLAQQGFTVLAPDLFKNSTADTIKEAESLVENSDPEFIRGVVAAATDYLADISSTKTIGALGFSFGAAWALVAAENTPDQVSAAVLFYGSYPMDFKRIKAKILGHFAEVDDFEPLDSLREMETDLKALGLDVTIYLYPAVSHWWMEEDRPQYDPEAAERAWQRTVDFLKASL